MIQGKRVIMSFVALAACVALIGGCNKHRHDDEYYSEGQPSAAQMQSAKPYPIVEVKEKNLKYAVLQQGAVAGTNISGWTALSPELFATLTDIKVAAPEPDKEMHPGYSTIVPNITAGGEKPENKMASVSGGYLIPKELHGWVAVDSVTLQAISKDFFKKPNK